MMPSSPAVASGSSASAPAAPVEAKEKAAKRSLKANVKNDEFGGPKKPPSGYMLFAETVREATFARLRAEAEKNGTKFEVSSTMKDIGAQYALISEADKNKFKEQAAELKAKYEKEFEAWKLTDEYKEFQKTKANHEKKKADKKVVDAAKESGMPKRPVAGYLQYGATQTNLIIAEMKANPETASLPNVEAMKRRAAEVKKRWEALGEAGQKEWNDKFAADQAKYKEDLAAWQQTDAGKAYEKAMEKNKKALATKRKAAKPAKGSKKRKTNDGAAEEEAEEEEGEVEATGEVEETGDAEES